MSFTQSASEIRCSEKCYDCVDEIIRSGYDFEQMIRWIRVAWVQVHRERLSRAEKDAYRKIEPIL